MAEQLAQLALAVLLGLNAVWCVLLHQRLRRLQRDGANLKKFAAEIDTLVERAAETLRGLRSECAAMESRLRRHSENARRRGDELKRFCDLASELTRRMQELPATGDRRRKARTDSGPVTGSRAVPPTTSGGPGAGSGPGNRAAAEPAIGDEDRAELLRLLDHLR